MSKYLPPYRGTSNGIKAELDLSNYATKTDLKNIMHIDVSSSATKTNSAALKSEVDKINIDKLKTVPNDLAKLSNVVKNDVVKKTTYNTLKNKVDAIDTSGFVTRTKVTTDTNALDDKIDKVEKKIPDISGLATKSSVTRVITEQEDYTDKVKKKTPHISGLASKTELTDGENKIPDVSGLATASALTVVENKILDITSLITKTDFDAKLKNISDRVTNNKSKDLLLDNELKRLKTLVGSSAKIKLDEVQKEISFVRGFISYTQNSNSVYECKVSSMKPSFYGILEWKPKDIYHNSNKNVLNSVQNTKNVAPDIKNINGQLYVSFNGNYFEQDPITIPNNVINVYVVYKLDPISSTRNTDYTIQNALFGAMKITKNTDSSKNNYKGYGLCFDEGGEFSHTVKQGNSNRATNVKNVIIFGVDTSSSIHATNRANKIYVMGEDFILGINGTTINAEKLFHNNFTEFGVKFVLRLHYNGDNSYLFANGRQELKFKAKDDQIINEKLCLGNLSSEWTGSESEITGLYGNIYDFIIDYKPIVGVDPIYDMHKYLMTKHGIK